MSGLTLSSMQDARDAEDRRLLDAGDHAALVESYYGAIIRRCQIKTPSDVEAFDVAAEVAVRLLSELKKGKRYEVPFRVVVHKVIDWKVAEYFAERGSVGELTDEPFDDPGFYSIEERYDLQLLLSDLPTREHDVGLLRILEGLNPSQIAERLGISRNNVDQAWHRAKIKLRARLLGGSLMSTEKIAELFDGFVEEYLGGTNPDVRDYLKRAGSASGELGELIDRFLQAAPVRGADTEQIVALNTRVNRETALTAARLHRRLKVDDLVERLRVALELPEVLRPRLREAYQELEGEQLEPAGVHERVWDALRGILGIDVRALPEATRARSFPTASYARLPDFEPRPPAEEHALADRNQSDEVNKLFRGLV